MSAYVECKTLVDDPNDVIEGLVELGYARENIEVHDVPQNLIGYGGGTRKDSAGNTIKANIIVRRNNVGSASNDVGFRRNDDGTYTLYESNYDVSYLQRKHGFPFKNGFKQAAAVSKIKREAKRQGFTVKMPKTVNYGQKVKVQVQRWRA